MGFGWEGKSVQSTILGGGRDEREVGSERGGSRERKREGGRPHFQGAGWSWGWAGLWAVRVGGVGGRVVGGIDPACVSIFPKFASKLYAPPLPVLPPPVPPPTPPAWENPVRINKSSRLLRDKGRVMETIWGPDISLMCNNLVVRARNKTPLLEPLLILAPNA